MQAGCLFLGLSDMLHSPRHERASITAAGIAGPKADPGRRRLSQVRTVSGAL